MLTRRHVIHGAAVAGLGGVFMGGVAWSKPQSMLRAILPSARHDTLAVKVLQHLPTTTAPELKINGREVKSERLDMDGYAWGFIQGDLKGGTQYTLTLRDSSGNYLRDPWHLKTLPSLNSNPQKFRLAFFTCAGGDEAKVPYDFLSVALRRALFDRLLAFEPEMVVANGDHIYWDLKTALQYRRDPATRARTSELYRKIAWIDEDMAFDSDTNRRSLNTIIGRQIASIYEDRFASVPMLFITDDHDYFENDNAGPWGCTLPPRPFTFGLQQRTEAMAYPYRLGVPKIADSYRSNTVETVKIGNLLEMALFDCRRGWKFGENAHVLFPEVETFLIERLRSSTAKQYIQAPSNPLAWTAGKLGEWYSDGPSDTSIFANDKVYWPKGWFEQHQRLVAALSEQPQRAAISISGDMHASAASVISRSADLDLSRNQVYSILPGTIGTGPGAFPSGARGVPPFHAKALEIHDVAHMEERNGFSIVDVFADRIEVMQFRWRPPDTLEQLAKLEPSHVFTIQRPG